ncbi:hypothetical protein QYE76_022697 [Lolium multiflorum]|uniref:Uncharacterized protein n=1 Tax=Lolium multiflorum TaxID=4521 RepID=A0AAD8VU06_LOLMU|nr:hypothetical protein QYE76_022697 [Lolium multiflorum]
MDGCSDVSPDPTHQHETVREELPLCGPTRLHQIHHEQHRTRPGCCASTPTFTSHSTSPASSSEEEFDNDDSTDGLLNPVRDAVALALAEGEAEEERAAHAAVDAELEQCRLAAAAAAEDSDSEISCRHRRRGWHFRRPFRRRRFANTSQNAASNPPHLRAHKVLDDLPDMDSDDEMLALLLEDEQAFDDDLRDHLLIIATAASGSSIGTPPSTKLTRENFLYWQAQVLPTLRGARVMGLLDGSDPAPSETIEAEDAEHKKITIPNPAYETWITKDQTVVSFLVNSLSEEVLPQVFGLAHAAEVWHALKELYSSRSKSRVSTLGGSLTNTKKLDLTAQQYISKMKGFAAELSAAGKPVDEDELKDYMLNGLDNSFNPLVAAINVVPSTSLSDMCSQLLAAENRDSMLQSTGQAPGSFTSSVNAATRFPSPPYGGGSARPPLPPSYYPYQPPPMPQYAPQPSPYAPYQPTTPYPPPTPYAPPYAYAPYPPAPQYAPPPMPYHAPRLPIVPNNNSPPYRPPQQQPQPPRPDQQKGRKKGGARTVVEWRLPGKMVSFVKFVKRKVAVDAASQNSDQHSGENSDENSTCDNDSATSHRTRGDSSDPSADSGERSASDPVPDAAASDPVSDAAATSPVHAPARSAQQPLATSPRSRPSLSPSAAPRQDVDRQPAPCQDPDGPQVTSPRCDNTERGVSPGPHTHIRPSSPASMSPNNHSGQSSPQSLPHNSSPGSSSDNDLSSDFSSAAPQPATPSPAPPVGVTTRLQ